MRRLSIWKFRGGIAQLVEHLHGMQGVRSSSLLASTNSSPDFTGPIKPNMQRHKVAAVLIACMFAATATAHAQTYRIAIVPLTDQPKLLRVHVEFGQPSDPPSTSSATPMPPAQGASSPELPPQHGRIGDRKTFWVRYYDATNPNSPSPWVSVGATLEYSTEHTDLWEDDDIDGQQDARFENASREAEQDYLSQRGRFGSLSYTEADRSRHPCIVPSRGELLSILVVKPGKVKDGYASTESYYSAASHCAANGHTNELPGLLIVALKDGTGDPKDELLRVGPAHEEQHLKNFVRHSIRGTTIVRTSMLNEGLSVLAQDFASEQISGRRDLDLAGAFEKEYLDDPGLVSLPAFYYYAGQQSHPSGAACYGGAYLLQRYLYDRFGDSYLNRVTDTEADGFTAMAAALPIPLPDALRDFGGYVLGLEKRSNLRHISDADFAVLGGSVSVFESPSPISAVHVIGATVVWTEQPSP
jgi:hypothetical protein